MNGAQIVRPPAHRISVAQIVILPVLCVGLGFWNPLTAYSALLGGLIAVLPHAWFTYRVFRNSGARSARQIAHGSYAAEVGKLVLAIAGFGVVFAMVKPLSAGAVFAGYGVMIVIQVLGAWMLLRNAGTGGR